MFSVFMYITLRFSKYSERDSQYTPLHSIYIYWWRQIELTVSVEQTL